MTDHGDNHPFTVDLDESDEQPVAEDKLDRIVRLAKRWVEEDREVARLERELEFANRALRLTSEEDLPNALAEAGIGGVPLADGSRVEIERRTFASVPKGKEDEAFAWLRANGAGPLVKNVVIANLPCGSDDTAERLKDFMRQLNGALDRKDQFSWSTKESIHPQTLQKFVRDADKDQRLVDDELLGVYRKRVAKVVPPKDDIF